MKQIKWLSSCILSFGLLVGCSVNEQQPNEKEMAKQTEETTKQEEKKQETIQEEVPKDSQEEKHEENKQQEVGAEPKQLEQAAAQQHHEETNAKQEVETTEKEDAKVVHQPTETPKQEQPEEGNETKVQPAPEKETQENQVQPTLPNPAPTPDPKPPVVEAKEVTISVRGDQNYLLGATKVEFKEGDTVFKVLERTGLDVDASGSGNSIYVKGINDLYEFDKGVKSGWVYRVNGALANQSAGSYKVKPGDEIEWLYTLDLGKDIGR